MRRTGDAKCADVACDKLETCASKGSLAMEGLKQCHRAVVAAPIDFDASDGTDVGIKPYEGAQAAEARTHVVKDRVLVQRNLSWPLHHQLPQTDRQRLAVAMLAIVVHELMDTVATQHENRMISHHLPPRHGVGIPS